MPDTHPSRRHPRVARYIAATPWLILPESLETIIAIAEGLNESPEAVEARMGRPLDNTHGVTMRDGVAILPVVGPITRYADIFSRISGATSIETLASDFNAALADPAVKAILLNVDSPGGAVPGVQEFADMVFAARGRKPICAYIGGYGASAAYWIASAADRIVVAYTAIVGSIGVITTVRTSKDAGTSEIVSSQSPNKRPDPASEAGRQKVQNVVDSLAGVFISRVATFRGVSEDVVMADFGQGDVFVGAQAVDQGLADAVGSLEATLFDLQQRQMPANQRRQPSMTVAAAPIIDRAYLSANHPALLAEIRQEGYAEGREKGLVEGKIEGASAERQRIKDVESYSMPGHEALIESLKYDGQTSGEAAGARVARAHKEMLTKVGADLNADAPQALPAAEAAVATAESLDHLSLEDRCKAKWENDPKVKADNSTFEGYLALEKAREQGRVRIY